MGAIYIVCNVGSCFILIQQVLWNLSKAFPEIPPAAKPVVNRLTIMRNVLLNFLLTGPLSVIYTAVMLSYVGSVPYNWLVLLTVSTFGASFPGFIFFLSKYDTTTAESAAGPRLPPVDQRRESTYVPMASLKSRSDTPTLQANGPGGVSFHSTYDGGKVQGGDQGRPSVSPIMT